MHLSWSALRLFFLDIVFFCSRLRLHFFWFCWNSFVNILRRNWIEIETAAPVGYNCKLKRNNDVFCTCLYAKYDVVAVERCQFVVNLIGVFCGWMSFDVETNEESRFDSDKLIRDATSQRTGNSHDFCCRCLELNDAIVMLLHAQKWYFANGFDYSLENGLSVCVRSLSLHLAISISSLFRFVCTPSFARNTQCENTFPSSLAHFGAWRCTGSNLNVLMAIDGIGNHICSMLENINTNNWYRAPRNNYMRCEEKRRCHFHQFYWLVSFRLSATTFRCVLAWIYLKIACKFRSTHTYIFPTISNMQTHVLFDPKFNWLQSKMVFHFKAFEPFSKAHNLNIHRSMLCWNKCVHKIKSNTHHKLGSLHSVSFLE